MALHAPHDDPEATMAREVDANRGGALARSLAECEAYWRGVPFFAERRRRYETERKYRLECAERGYEPTPDDWVITDIRSGEWERRRKRSMQNLLHDRARLTRLKREGYSFDAEHRLVAPALTRIEVPEPRESGARPRERRAATPRSGSRASRSDPDEPGDLEVIPPTRFRSELWRALGGAV
jgi:hypothetical protein